ncbi:hypothetical protein DMX05_21380 [Pseudomonas soli]|uniref:Uncharacterized protein n=1 Tax=Pseudomonas soli TaxID=1306993 RepID=A0AAJ5SUM5_9PSED|nr:hypothetical protein [Pseudomonas soli]PYC35715.1 hypothetical protein DMX05_21380 [Pseudomonas soli]UXZ46809.1 hypothetical protein K7K07_07355 [Pseudomonas soli]
MSIEQQVEILSELVQIMHDSADGAYDSLCCEFDHEAYEGGWSVGSAYAFVRDGVSVSKILADPDDRASDLVNQLHQVMQAHTGGDWSKFLLSVDGEGRANTKFTY